jgi:hypothetical protein
MPPIPVTRAMVFSLRLRANQLCHSDAKSAPT